MGRCRCGKRGDIDWPRNRSCGLTSFAKTHQAQGLQALAMMQELAVSKPLKASAAPSAPPKRAKHRCSPRICSKVLAHLPPDLSGTRERVLLLAG